MQLLGFHSLWKRLVGAEVADKGWSMPGSAEQPRVDISKQNKNPFILSRAEETKGHADSTNPLINQQPLLNIFTETMPQLVWSTNANGVCDYVNEKLTSFIGKGTDLSSENSWMEHIHPQDQAPMLEAWHRSISEDKVFETEYRLRRSDGEYIWHLVRAFPVKNAQNQTVRWVGTCTDIDKHKRTEVALRELEVQLRSGEERFVLAETASRTGIWDWDLVKDNVYYSPRYKSLLGFSEEEFPNSVKAFTPRLHPEDRDTTWTAIAAALRGDSPNYEAQFRLRHKDGSYRWILSRGFVFRDGNGTAVRMSGVHLDITDYKTTALALEATERELRRVMASISDYLWSAEINEAGEFKYLFYSPAVKRITGRPEEYYYPGPDRWLQTVHPDDRAWLLDDFQKLRSGEISHLEREYRILWPDGSIHWVRDSALTTRNGNTIRIDGVVSEITERKTANDRLNQWEKIFNHAGWGVAITSAVSNIVQAVNPAFALMHGQELEELTGKRMESVLSPESRDTMREAVLRADDCGHASFEAVHVKKDGSSFPMQTDVTAIKDSEGNVLYRASNFQDITHLKKTETELKRKAEELARSNAELEQFAYVASHDLKEPLRMVSSYVRLLERQYKGKLSPEADQFIDFAVQGATRMYALIGDLLEYSRVGTRERALRPVDMNAVLAQSLENLGLAIKESSAVIEARPLPTLLGENSLLVQLFQNIIGNSIKFRLGAPLIRITAKLEGDHWTFAISDNGIGIHPKYAEKIYVIFQKLHPKDRYGGTGIGLAICKKIVERHQGRIWMDSTPGRGTTFYFALPVEPQH